MCKTNYQLKLSYNLYNNANYYYIMKTELFEHESIIYTILVGKNKEDNFKIIDDSLDTYIWFHIKDEPSCHVILKNTDNLRSIPKQVIKHCAYLCKINSKSKTQKICFVIYTPLYNVIKTEIVGKVSVSTYKTIKI